VKQALIPISFLFRLFHFCFRRRFIATDRGQTFAGESL